MLIFASPNCRTTSATAPTRSWPWIRNARLGPASFQPALWATRRKVPGSSGTKSSWVRRPWGKPEKARRFTPSCWSVASARAPSPGRLAT